MVERLSRLMHDEVDVLDIPAPRAVDTLAAGRRLRARRRSIQGVAGAAVVAVVAAGALAWWPHGTGADRVVDPLTPRSAPPAYGVGSTVVIGGAVASVPDTVHSLHYTSVGVLVRSNPHDGASDGSGPESLTLVRDDGSTVDLGTVPEGVGPATDPGQPYYALAEADGDGFVAVVRDAKTGDEEARVALPDLPPSYWEVPPLALSGDTVFVGYRSSTVAVDWHTGQSHEVDGLPGGIPEVYGGRALVPAGDSIRVVDVGTGEELADLPVAGDPSDGEAGAELAPDGRFALVWRVDPETYEPAPEFTVVDIADGSTEQFPGEPFEWGWTPTGDLFTVADGTVTLCEATTGDCADSPAPVSGRGGDLTRLGGRIYES